MEKIDNPYNSEPTAKILVQEVKYVDWAIDPGDNPPKEGIVTAYEYTGCELFEEIWDAISRDLFPNPESCLITGTWEGKEYKHKYINMSRCN